MPFLEQALQAILLKLGTPKISQALTIFTRRDSKQYKNVSNITTLLAIKHFFKQTSFAALSKKDCVPKKCFLVYLPKNSFHSQYIQILGESD